jgi:hypothetical protein
VGLLGVIFGWPWLPVRGVVGLAEIIREEAERELHDPAAVRRQLEEAAEAEQAGTISDEELSRVQQQAVSRLAGRAGQPPEADRQSRKER